MANFRRPKRRVQLGTKLDTTKRVVDGTGTSEVFVPLDWNLWPAPVIDDAAIARHWPATLYRQFRAIAGVTRVDLKQAQITILGPNEEVIEAEYRIKQGDNHLAVIVEALPETQLMRDVVFPSNITLAKFLVVLNEHANVTTEFVRPERQDRGFDRDGIGPFGRYLRSGR